MSWVQFRTPLSVADVKTLQTLGIKGRDSDVQKGIRTLQKKLDTANTNLTVVIELEESAAANAQAELVANRRRCDSLPNAEAMYGDLHECPTPGHDSLTYCERCRYKDRTVADAEYAIWLEAHDAPDTKTGAYEFTFRPAQNTLKVYTAMRQKRLTEFDRLHVKMERVRAIIASYENAPAPQPVGVPLEHVTAVFDMLRERKPARLTFGKNARDSHLDRSYFVAPTGPSDDGHRYVDLFYLENPEKAYDPPVLEVWMTRRSGGDIVCRPNIVAFVDARNGDFYYKPNGTVAIDALLNAVWDEFEALNSDDMTEAKRPRHIAAGVCIRCGRDLSDDESRSRGLHAACVQSNAKRVKRS